MAVHKLMMGSRLPTHPAREAVAKLILFDRPVIPDTVIQVRGSSSTACHSDDPNLCQKPEGGNMTVIIACSVIIPVILALIVLYILHRRVVRRQRLEDLKDPHKMLDFGLGDNAGQDQVGKRKSTKMGAGEKDMRARYARQMSMDMNLSSPYLLPPDIQGSRESMNSLARTLHQNEDPYRPVASYLGGDEKGLMTPSMMTRSSYSKEVGRTSRATIVDSLPGQQSSMPPKTSAYPLDGTMSTSPPPPLYKEPVQPFPARIEPVIPQIVESSPTQETLTLPMLRQPPSPAQSGAWKPSPVPPKGPMGSAVDIGGYHESTLDNNRQRDVAPIVTEEQAPAYISPLTINSFPVSPRLTRKQEAPVSQMTTTIAEEPQEYFDDYAQMPEMPRPHHFEPQPHHDEPRPHHDQPQPHYYEPQPPHFEQQPQYLEAEEEPRGRNMQRLSQHYDRSASEWLNVPPPSSNKRLSVGFRPLPPVEITESEDPEYRANRIRSFYKEYFEDNSRNEPMPPLPMYAQNNGPDYYEDYDAGYLGEAAYFDPESNAFVMPYAQPVARRAMTPPPSGHRFPGPRAGPRGPYGPPSQRSQRPGSSASQGMGRRPATLASGRWGRSRAGSVASSGRFGPSKQAVPPPAALITLPNPSKLTDDSFALMGAIDFAPPDTFAERASGRPRSPAGGRRPYKVNVPVASPLITSFEELPTLPSPHLLQTSGSFTGLDFAPPRKFTESDSRSETASIRSNRSGISAVQLGAIRNGAGRVSRLPGDSVFTQAALADQLKPQWGIRP